MKNRTDEAFGDLAIFAFIVIRFDYRSIPFKRFHLGEINAVFGPVRSSLNFVPFIAWLHLHDLIIYIISGYTK